MSGRERTKSGLRPIAEPFVVAPPEGVRTRTRVHLTPEEEAVFEQIGVFLGGQYRATLVDRITLGAATKEQAVWRQVRKQVLTAATSSRWAGAITRTAIDSYDLGMRGLNAHVDSLAAAISTLDARLAAPVAGGGRLWRNRQNLAEIPMTLSQWEERWADERMFLTADGESGKRFGNETIRLTDEGVPPCHHPADPPRRRAWLRICQHREPRLR